MPPKISWTPEQICIIEDLYSRQKQSLETIAKKYSCNPATIKKLLIKEGHEIRSSKEHYQLFEPTENEKKQIIYDYTVNSFTFKQLCRKYHRRESTLIEIVGNLKRGRLDHYRYREFNHDYFELKNLELNPYQSYWFGFILGDGDIKGEKGSYVTRLRLMKSDVGHIKKFRKAIDSNHLILEDGEGKGIKIDSKKMFHDLYFLGKRAFNESVVTIPLNAHILRGLIDSDGCFNLYKSGYQIQFFGGYTLLKQVRQYLYQEIQTPKNLIFPVANTLWGLCFNSNTAWKVIDFIYSCSLPEIRLDRKYNNFHKLKTEKTKRSF